MSAISLSTARLSPIGPVSSAAASDPAQAALEGTIARIKQVAERLTWQIPSKKEHFNDPVTFNPMQKSILVGPCGHTFDARTVAALMARTKECSLCRTTITTCVTNYALQTEIEEEQKRGLIPTFTHFKLADRDLADTYLQIARKLVRKGRYNEALDNYRMAFLYTASLEDYLEVPALYETKLIPRKEETALAYLHLACYQLKEGKVPEAIESLEHAKKASFAPSKIDALLVELQLSLDSSPEQLAKVMAIAATQEDPKERISMYKQIIAQVPSYLNAYKAEVPLVKDPAEKKALLLEAAKLAEEQGQSELALYFREEAEKRPPPLTAFSKELWTNPAAFKDQLLPYSQELVEFLAGDCTIWPGKKRSETHIVMPLPPTIMVEGSEVPRTLASLDQLDKASGDTGYRYIWDQIPQDTAAENTFRWAVMTNDVLPGSRNKSYAAQVALIPEGYEVPGVLDAATAILWKKQLTGTRRFSNDPWTYTRCREPIQGYQLVVGGFAPGGLVVDSSHDYGGDDDSIGVGALRKFRP